MNSTRNSAVNGHISKKLSSTTGNLNNWGTKSSVSTRTDKSTTPSPYISEIQANLTRKLDRQQQRRIMTQGDSSAKTFSQPAPNRYAHVSSRIRTTSLSTTFTNGYVPRSFSRTRSTVSAAVTYYGNGLSHIQNTNGSSLIDGSHNSVFDEEETFAVCDVQIQVRPQVKEKSVQVLFKMNDQTPDTSNVTQEQNAAHEETIMDENFQMRRVIDDLRFRLTEMTHEKEVLEEEVAQFRKSNLSQKALDIEESAVIRSSEGIQTDPNNMDAISARKSSLAKRKPSEESKISLLEDEEEPPIETLLDHSELDGHSDRDVNDVLRNISGEKSASNGQESVQTDAGRSFIQSVVAGHIERLRWLQKIKDVRKQMAQQQLQAYFRGHLERKRLVSLREEE